MQKDTQTGSVGERVVRTLGAHHVYRHTQTGGVGERVVS